MLAGDGTPFAKTSSSDKRRQIAVSLWTEPGYYIVISFSKNIQSTTIFYALLWF